MENLSIYKKIYGKYVIEKSYGRLSETRNKIEKNGKSRREKRKM